MRDVFSRLYRTKMILSCLVLVVTGISLLVVARTAVGRTGWTSWLPWSELGGILVGAGLLGVWLDNYLSREQDEIDELRLRRLLHEQAPALRDAVLEAFAANHEDLKRVATPELLDQLISNSLAMRLGDHQFASEIYRDIRDQAIAAAERWYDAHVSIELRPPQPEQRARRPRHGGDKLLSVTVRWEYTTVPRHSHRRFVCVSDREEYAELVREGGATSAWFMHPGNGIEANRPDAFELLRFSVDGQERPIRRSARKTSQTYIVGLTPEQMGAQQPVTIAYTYQTLMEANGHLLFFDIEQPTRDLRVDFDYTGCDLAKVSTLDLVPSVRPTRIEPSPPGTPGEVIRVDFDGWIFPRSGVAFVWTLATEEIRPSTSDRRPAGSASRH